MVVTFHLTGGPWSSSPAPTPPPSPLARRCSVKPAPSPTPASAVSISYTKPLPPTTTSVSDAKPAQSPSPSPTPSQRRLHLLRQATPALQAHRRLHLLRAKPFLATTTTSLCRLFFHHQPTPSSTPSSPSSPAPSLLDLQASYILHNVSFTALLRELLAVVRLSDAGKSTLLDIVSTHIIPTSRSLYLNSSPLQPSSFRRLSSHLPQHHSSLPHLTVSETFFFATRLLSASPSTVASLLSELRFSHLSHECLRAPSPVVSVAASPSASPSSPTQRSSSSTSQPPPSPFSAPSALSFAWI